ncbi:MAG: hypothetical protein J7K46_12250 [Bacteroidales bacterium]|nr:hypothetical protein [Bacteroidales bacterium]
MSKILKIFLIFLAVLTVLSYFYIILPVWGIPFNHQRHGHPPLTPLWALECWLWEDDVNTAARVDELLTGYAEHDIPVRTILIDSPWSMRYNDYEVDTIRYPYPEEWFANLQERGYRVVLWTTSMVNSYNKDTRIRNSEKWYNMAKEKGYLAGNGFQYNWWKGKGGFIDYTNPEAMKWWHSLQKQVLRLGVDGWKLDGTATYFRGKAGPLPVFYQRAHSGRISTRHYMDLYYRNEYSYGHKQNPGFITLSRAMDRRYHPEGFAPIDASPVNWVGDQEHYWQSDEQTDHGGDKKDIALKGIQGFESAIKNIRRSAGKGYNIVGSDIAGFSGRKIPPRLYIRWAQFSTFCGLFLNGGHGERALWKRSDQELQIIRKFSWLHTELVPYMYTYVINAHHGGRVLMKPVSGKYQYLFGDYLLVAPIYEDHLSRKVKLPKGNWRYFFNDKEVIKGPVTFTREYSLDEFPVFIKEGSILPMNIRRAYSGIGDSTSAGYLTLLIYPGLKNSFPVYREGGNKVTIVTVDNTEDDLKISLEGEYISHILTVHLDHKPADVMLDGKDIPWRYDARRQKLIIKTRDYPKGNYIIKR